MKNFVKAMDKEGAAFQHLCTLFPGLSSAKLKEGIHQTSDQGGAEG